VLKCHSISDSEKTPGRSSRFSHVYLLADGVSGACDAAAAFLTEGRQARVWFGPRALFPTPEPIQAFSTNSRTLPPARAARTMTAAIAALHAVPGALIFKKIDFAAHGPFAHELLAAHRALGTRAILLALALPVMGSTVHGGILTIEDSLRHRTRIDLALMFPAKVRSRIALIADPSQIPAAIASGKIILICDTLSRADLIALARTAAAMPGLLYAGTSGLARVLTGLLTNAASTQDPPRSSRTLIVSSSPNPVTQLQLKVLDLDRFPSARVLRVRYNRDKPQILDAFQSFAPQALVFAGDHTALMVVQSLGAQSLILRGEIAPFISWGILQGGVADGCTVMTKSCGSGAPTALNDILEVLARPA
jgi:D-threonate/D-erythronate kinase